MKVKAQFKKDLKSITAAIIKSERAIKKSEGVILIEFVDTVSCPLLDEIINQFVTKYDLEPNIVSDEIYAGPVFNLRKISKENIERIWESR